MDQLLAILGGYLLGAIPFGLLLTRAAGLGDVRDIGSGNIGATNVLRTGKKGLAAATLLLDVAKGFLAAWLAAKLWMDADHMLDFVLLAGVGALIGHCFPVWLRFKGGKGVATMLGVSLAFDWRIGLASAVVWLAMALLTRISSLSGMASAVAAPITAFSIYATMDPNAGMLFQGFLERLVWLSTGLALSVMSAIVVFQHRANIGRLIKGTEPKIGASKE